MKKKNRVVEFTNIGQLNEFLDWYEFYEEPKIQNPIKKIFRSPDGVYFVWFVE